MSTAATPTTNPLTIEPREDDNTVDYAAHALIKDAAFSINVSHGGYTVTAPISMVRDELHRQGQIINGGGGGQVMLTFRAISDVIALIPAGQLVRVHMSAVDPKKAERALRALVHQVGWKVAAVAWNHTTIIGSNVRVRDAYMGLRS